MEFESGLALHRAHSNPDLRMVPGRPNILMLGPDTVAGNHLSKTFPTREEVQRSMAPKASEVAQNHRKISSQQHCWYRPGQKCTTSHRTKKVRPNDPEERRQAQASARCGELIPLCGANTEAQAPTKRVATIQVRGAAMRKDARAKL